MRLRFDFAGPDGRNVPIECIHPRRIITATTVNGVRPAMRDVEMEVARGACAAGFVSYEAAPAFDAALETRAASDVPLVWFGVFDAVAVTSDGNARPSMPAGALPPIEPIDWISRASADEYRRGVAAVQRAIAAGDSYQANYTIRLQGAVDASRLEARYLALLRAHRPPFAAYLDLGRWRILSLSPELFFRIDDGRVTASPMKGTARRGRWQEEDDAQARALAESAKNRAENVMIVDLTRNDLGRIAETGSIAVTSLFEVQRYPSAFQLVSTVAGTARAGTTLTEVFAALFPAGSVTGAPKTSSMRLIGSLEDAPRGVYCGAIGFVLPGGHAVFNVAIRTAVVDVATGEAELGVGGGITWDSSVDDELAEAMVKATFLDLPPDFSLVETMRLEDGHLRRLPGHLDRLVASAAYLEVPLDRGRIVTALAEHIAGRSGESRRVRLLVSGAGVASVTSTPLEPPARDPHLVALATSPVSSQDRYLCHKTTHRAAYDTHRLAQPDVFDVLLWNEAGDLTEFTIGNLVVELDGVRVTPPRECGLLAGVFRSALLDAGTIVERRLIASDLARATRVWLINSVREWVPVTFL